MSEFDLQNNNYVQRLILCAAIERALFEGSTNSRVAQNLHERFDHCFCDYLDKPDHLCHVLRESCGISYVSIMYSIRRSLNNYLSYPIISAFVIALDSY